MAKKIKRIPKTKAQIIADLKGNAKFVEKMKFTREKFWPALVECSKNVDDAKMLLASICNIQMEKFLGLMKEKKFSDLKLKDILDPKDESYESYISLLSLFDDMTVFDAKDAIEGMKQELDIFILDEMRLRPLSTLKCKWIDQM